MLTTDMEKSNLSLHDPFIGYLVTIAATIQLDKSQNKSSEIADSARFRFERCREFVQKMSAQWPSMTTAVRYSEDSYVNLLTCRSWNC
jgi:hypothetical protein